MSFPIAAVGSLNGKIAKYVGNFVGIIDNIVVVGAVDIVNVVEGCHLIFVTLFMWVIALCL